MDGPLKKLNLDGKPDIENQKPVTPAFEICDRGTVPLSHLDLSICRKPAQPASSRSKAVDSMAAHSFQTARCIGCVSPVSDKPDRFYCYDDYDNLLSCLRKKSTIVP